MRLRNSEKLSQPWYIEKKKEMLKIKERNGKWNGGKNN